MADDIRWIRSYALEEESGTLGTVCIYQASSAEAIRRHRDIAALPVDEIIPVMDAAIRRLDTH
ncbi:MAG: nickel-binding protein [Sedimenticolaceae bacterium]